MAIIGFPMLRDTKHTDQQGSNDDKWPHCKDLVHLTDKMRVMHSISDTTTSGNKYIMLLVV